MTTKLLINRFSPLSYLFAIFLFQVSFSSCVYSYDPNVTKYEDILIVDGGISNLPGPYQIKLSQSYQFYKRSGDPTTGAEVSIIEDTGLKVNLREITEGVYITTDESFIGKIDHSYKILIKTENHQFESNFEQLTPPIPIDSIYWEYKNNNTEQEGIALLLDTHDPSNSTRFYGWTYDETWKFRVPIDIVDHPEWKECYAYKEHNYFKIGNSAQRINDVINKYRLAFYTEDSYRLYIRYTVLVTQYSLSESAYHFLHNIEKINQNQGSLFDPVSSSILSNIKSTDQEDIPVLGYFLVAGATKKRIFIDRSELPETYNPTSGFEDCNTFIALVPLSVENIYKHPTVDSLIREGYSIYEQYLTTLPSGEPGLQLSMAKRPCYNCTLNGSSEAPSYWTEK